MLRLLLLLLLQKLHSASTVFPKCKLEPERLEKKSVLTERSNKNVIFKDFEER